MIRLEEIRTLLFGDCIPTKGTQSGGWVDCDGPNGPHFGTPISEAPLDQDDKGQQYSYSSADLEGLQGFAEAAVADAWGATKSALKKARAAHGGGQEASIVDEVKKLTPTTSFQVAHLNEMLPSMRLQPTSPLSKRSMSGGGSDHPILDGVQEWNQRSRRNHRRIRAKVQAAYAACTCSAPKDCSTDAAALWMRSHDPLIPAMACAPPPAQPATYPKE